MKYTEQRKQEAENVMERCTAIGKWEDLLQIAEIMLKYAAPEEREKTRLFQQQQEEAQRIRAEQAAAREQREQARLTAWKAERLKGFRIPRGNSLKTSDESPLLSVLYFYGLQDGAIFEAGDILEAVYEWGFKRGQAYQMNQSKKKAALHGANMKNGGERITDEL